MHIIFISKLMFLKKFAYCLKNCFIHSSLLNCRNLKLLTRLVAANGRNDWLQARLTLRAGTRRAIFRAIRGGSSSGEPFGDIAIDDVTVFNTDCDGNTGGDPGGNTGGDPGGNTGGDSGGDTGGNSNLDVGGTVTGNEGVVLHDK